MPKSVPSQWTPNFLHSRPVGLTPPPPPLHPPTSSHQGSLRQIASLLCKFVQPINSVSLGVAVWQQEWLESWATRRSSLGRAMRAASQWRRRITLPLSPSIQPSRLFFWRLLVARRALVPAVNRPLKRCDCWTQKPEDGRNGFLLGGATPAVSIRGPNPWFRSKINYAVWIFFFFQKGKIWCWVIISLWWTA